MPKLSQLTVSRTHRILLFGAPKSGKSLLVGKLAEKYNLLWFDLEKGHDVLFQLPKEWQERVEILELPDTRTYPIAIETALKVIKGGKGSVCHEHGKWSCLACRTKKPEAVTEIELNSLGPDWIVVFDSLTQLTNSAIAYITKNQPEDYKLQFDDWAYLGKLMDTFLGHGQQANFNLICISHETETEMEDGKNKLVPTAGTRNFSRNSAKYFDEVIYCEVKNRSHVVGSSTLYSNNILTGSRTGNILEGMEEASLLPIFTGERPTLKAVDEKKSVGSATSSLNSLLTKIKTKD